MSFLDDILSASGEIAEEVITLPASGKRVRVREMLAGELVDLSAMTSNRELRMIAAMVTDADTGAPLADRDSMEDLEKLRRLRRADFTALLEAVNRMNGEEEGNSKATESSPTLSVASSESPSVRSVA